MPNMNLKDFGEILRWIFSSVLNDESFEEFLHFPAISLELRSLPRAT